MRRTRPRVGLARATKPYWRRYRASPVMAGPNPSWPARPSWPGWARPSVHVRSYVNDARTRACGCRGSSIAFGGRAGLTIGRSAGASQHWPGTLLGRRFCGATDKTPVANSVNAPWRPGSSRRGAHFPSAVGPVAPMGPADSNVPKYFPINATYAFQTYNPIGDRRSINRARRYDNLNQRPHKLKRRPGWSRPAFRWEQRMSTIHHWLRLRIMVTWAVKVKVFIYRK